MTSKIIPMVAAMVGIGVAATACGTPASAPAAPAGHIRAGLAPAHGRDHVRPGGAAKRRRVARLAPAGHGAFGTGCKILHRSGPGSQAGLAAAPAADAISREPGLSEFAHALRLTGLTSTLNASRALTVFVPDNAAFRALSAGNLRALLTTRSDLVRVLRFHLVARRVTPAELTRHPVVTTEAGTKIHVVRADRSLGVNNALVTCGNVRTANATVYIVNRLIVPAS